LVFTTAKAFNVEDQCQTILSKGFPEIKFIIITLQIPQTQQFLKTGDLSTSLPGLVGFIMR
jgi:hypothetical protein